MSKANEWAQQDNETGQQWLIRLKGVDLSGLTSRERLLFSVRHRQAVAEADVEIRREMQTLVNVETVDLRTLKWERAEAAKESLALALAKDVYRCLTPEDCQHFEQWLKAGCPEEQEI